MTPAAPAADPPGVHGEVAEDRSLGDVRLTHWYTPAGRVLAALVQRIAHVIGTYPALVLTLVVGAGLVLGLSWIAAEVYDAVSDDDGVAGVDRPLLDFALTLRSPGVDAVVTGFTDLAGTIGMPVIAVTAMLILSIRRRSWTPVILIAAAGGGSLLMTVVGKDVVARTRPPLSDAVPPFEYSPSFPSGHTLNAVAVIGVIAYLLMLRRRSRGARWALAGGAALFALLVGCSRVFLGHHWFTDVLAGWLLGAAWLSLVITAHRLYLTVRERRHAVRDVPEPPPPTHHRVVVIGGGNGGLSIAGRLRRAGVRDIAVVEPRSQHVFAPLQSHIAGGVARASEAARRQADVTPRGVTWVHDTVTGVDPVSGVVDLASGGRVSYDQLVVAAGIEQRWGAVPGLADAMRTPSGVSNYSYDLAAKASPALRDLRSGTVVFVQPPEPASCAGVAQKPMYLACDWWRATGVRDGIRVVFVSPEPTAFGVAAISDELHRKLDEYGIETRFDRDLLEVRPARREIVVGRAGSREKIAYDLLHAAPPSSPAAWIAASGLGDADGFVDVDPRMLRHRAHPNVWALGDAAALGIVRSGGAIRRQSQVLAKNLGAVLAGRPPRARYDGYTVCPVTVSRHTVVFAEFDRSGRLAPTVPGWTTLYRERRLSWLFDRHVLPWVYWNLILRGRA